jgi:hypothetical protein
LNVLPEWAPTALGAVGMVALFWPAYRANRIARRLAQLNQITRGGRLPGDLGRVAAETAEERRAQIGEWSWRDELLMWIGYGSIGLSYLSQFITAD